MKSVIFVSGPHGSGKSTLIESLTERFDFIDKNTFDINFIKEFPNFASLTNFERCLLRLYHREHIARFLTEHHSSKLKRVLLVDRGIYDSEAYIYANLKMGWITRSQYDILTELYNQIHICPDALILNPDPQEILHRLNNRIQTGNRRDRDRIFQSEDTELFINYLHEGFSQYQGRKYVLYLEDNGKSEINIFLEWIKV